MYLKKHMHLYFILFLKRLKVFLRFIFIISIKLNVKAIIRFLLYVYLFKQKSKTASRKNKTSSEWHLTLFVHDIRCILRPVLGLMNKTYTLSISFCK